MPQPTKVRHFAAKAIDQDLSGAPLGHRENELFFNCTFKDLRNTTFKNCDLNHSKFTSDRAEELLGLTVTLNCHSFENVELSPFVFDLMLTLLLKTKGNVEKRRKLIEVIGEDRLRELLTQLKQVE